MGVMAGASGLGLGFWTIAAAIPQGKESRFVGLCSPAVGQIGLNCVEALYHPRMGQAAYVQLFHSARPQTALPPLARGLSVARGSLPDAQAFESRRVEQ